MAWLRRFLSCIALLFYAVAALHPDVTQLALNRRGSHGKRQVGGAVVGGAVNVTPTSVSPTLIVSTITLANGAVRTTQIAFSQTFAAGATQGAAVPAGIIGLPTGAAATASASTSQRDIVCNSKAGIVAGSLIIAALFSGFII